VPQVAGWRVLLITARVATDRPTGRPGRTGPAVSGYLTWKP
jgi:hypothetical protein